MSGLPVKVSLIVPVYNVEKYLSTCLHSCVNQTLFDIEIICVNDGSTDNSLAVLEAYAKEDYRIRIINKPNGGLSSARNAGIKAANGTILMFLDSDDYLAPNACERVWKETLEAPTDVVIFGTNIFPTKPRASDWHYHTLNIRTHRCWGFTPDVLFKEPGAKPFVWRQAYAKKFFEEHNLLFDESVKYGEDMVFQMEALPHGENFAFIADKLYNYRWYRVGSLMDSYNYDLDEKVQKHLGFINNICQYWEKEGWFDLYGKQFVQWLLEFVVSDIRKEETTRDADHVNALKELLGKYDLEKYLDKMPGSVRSLVRIVKKGSV